MKYLVKCIHNVKSKTEITRFVKKVRDDRHSLKRSIIKSDKKIRHDLYIKNLKFYGIVKQYINIVVKHNNIIIIY